jgi:hypothetical protein
MMVNLSLGGSFLSGLFIFSGRRADARLMPRYFFILVYPDAGEYLQKTSDEADYRHVRTLRWCLFVRLNARECRPQLSEWAIFSHVRTLRRRSCKADGCSAPGQATQKFAKAASEQLGLPLRFQTASRAAAGLNLIVEIAMLLSVLVADDEASTVHFIDCPGRREATLGHSRDSQN